MYVCGPGCCALQGFGRREWCARVGNDAIGNEMRVRAFHALCAAGSAGESRGMR